MNKKVYIIVGIVGALLLVFGAILYQQSGVSQTSKPTQSSVEDLVRKEEVKVQIGVDYADKKASVSGEVVTRGGSNVLDSLKKGHEVGTKKFSFGEMVEAIDGVGGEEGKFWIYYVNGEAAKVGADQYEVKDGDRIEWRLENRS